MCLCLLLFLALHLPNWCQIPPMRLHHLLFLVILLSTPTITTATSSSDPPIPLKDNSEQLLMIFCHNFHWIEKLLYMQLAKMLDGSLNEVRSTFLSTGRGMKRRLDAWQRKHFGPKVKLLGELVAEEPIWWGKDCHVVPGGNIIVRENEWGSIFALLWGIINFHSPEEGQQLMENPFFLVPLIISWNCSKYRLLFIVGSQSSTPPISLPEHAPSSSFFSGYRLFTSGSRNQPDPDQEGVVWNEPEQYNSTISRKEPHAHRRMRDILPQKSLAEPSSSSGVST